MYRDLSHYLVERLAACGDNAASLAERHGWSATYLNNIINGQFRPSRQRCLVLAADFGDDPNLILALAGFYVPGDHQEQFIAALNSLTPDNQQAALDYLEYLKWRELRANGTVE